MQSEITLIMLLSIHIPDSSLLLQVLVVPMLAGASGKAHVKPLTYFSALMALLGVALLVEKGGAFNPTQGDLWSLASAIFFGVQVFS